METETVTFKDLKVRAIANLDEDRRGYSIGSVVYDVEVLLGELHWENNDSLLRDVAGACRFALDDAIERTAQIGNSPYDDLSDGLLNVQSLLRVASGGLSRLASPKIHTSGV